MQCLRVTLHRSTAIMPTLMSHWLPGYKGRIVGLVKDVGDEGSAIAERPDYSRQPTTLA
jgi:hypothetical protein